MMDNRKRIAEYVVREVARRVVSLALEATGDAECLRRAEMLRNLAPDASMDDVGRTCDGSTRAARAAGAASVAYYATRAAYAADYADSTAYSAYAVVAYSADEAAVAAEYAAKAETAWAAAVNHAAAVATDADAGDAGAAEYEDILAEARSLFSAS